MAESATDIKEADSSNVELNDLDVASSAEPAERVSSPASPSSIDAKIVAFPPIDVTIASNNSDPMAPASDTSAETQDEEIPIDDVYEKAEEKLEDIPKSHLNPADFPDGGFGWIVVLAGFMSLFFTVGGQYSWVRNSLTLPGFPWLILNRHICCYRLRREHSSNTTTTAKHFQTPRISRFHSCRRSPELVFP